jgi:hypothetical protein
LADDAEPDELVLRLRDDAVDVRLLEERPPPEERLPDDRLLDELDRFDPPVLRRSAICSPSCRVRG